MKVTRFEKVAVYSEVEAFQLGVAPSEGLIFMQAKIKGAEFPTVLIFSRSDALLLAGHLTGTATGIAIEAGETANEAEPKGA